MCDRPCSRMPWFQSSSLGLDDSTSSKSSGFKSAMLNTQCPDDSRLLGVPFLLIHGPFTNTFLIRQGPSVSLSHRTVTYFGINGRSKYKNLIGSAPSNLYETSSCRIVVRCRYSIVPLLCLGVGPPGIEPGYPEASERRSTCLELRTLAPGRNGSGPGAD